LARAIQNEGFAVLVLNRYGIHRKEDNVAFEGVFEGIHYLYCSGTSLKPPKYIRRNLLKFKGLFNEIKCYWKYSRSNQLSGALISTNHFHNILFYWLLGKVFRTTTVVDNVEYWGSIKDFRGFQRFDKFLYDRFYSLFTDKIICISDFLISKVRNSKKQTSIKIPVITDFDKFKKGNTRPGIIKEKYFIFCGSAVYFQVIDFVISAFEKLTNDRNVYLVLVTGNTDVLRGRIEKSPVKKNILVQSNVPYNDLVNLYKNSQGLIIPMRNSDQDRARFPHKISEYCASGRPIITNRVGEIVNYFNNSNSYLCDDYDEDEYAASMHKILAEPENAKLIAAQGYKTGETYFNYKSYSKEIKKLFTD